MLTKITIRNFKRFESVEIELGERVVLVGPNNSGKTSALQALALWSLGVRRWIAKRGEGAVPKERAGVTINRRDLVSVPVPSANLLWRDLHVREGYKGETGDSKTRNIRIGVEVEGIAADGNWRASLEFDYANEESIYVRSTIDKDGNRIDVPAAAAALRLAYLPPMSGLAANETRLDEGAIDVRIGEGRTAEVLRNLCWRVYESNPEQWGRIASQMNKLWGVELDPPEYVKERGEIVMSFTASRNVRLDLAASGRGQQQTLLLLAHMAANPNSVLLLDEPDAHLEILRQGQIYDVLTDTASETNSQIIMASHSEVILNKAADRDTVVAFVGKPHRVDDRGAQVLKSLREIGFEQYLLAEQTGWVLYLEGSTDLAILKAFAEKLGHSVADDLERPFFHFIGNQPSHARNHFYALRAAKPDLRGIAIFDRLDKNLTPDPKLKQVAWRRREIENYLCQRDTLLCYAEAQGRSQQGDMFAEIWRNTMEQVIGEMESALQTVSKPDPWGAELKVSDEFLTPLFKNFFARLGIYNLMSKTDFHTLAPFVDPSDIDPEVVALLDEIKKTASEVSSGEVASGEN